MPDYGDVEIGNGLDEAIALLQSGSGEQQIAAATWLACEPVPRAMAALERCVDGESRVAFIARAALGIEFETRVALLVEEQLAAKGVLLERAVRNARVTGKEPFDMAAFRVSGCVLRGSEADHRYDYMTRNELRTMAEYIAHRKQMDPWDG